MPKKRRKSKKPKQPPILPNLHRPILAAFFLSGFAGLMHQVVWAKLLVQLIGATAYAQAVVLAVFMGTTPSRVLKLTGVCLNRRA